MLLSHLACSRRSALSLVGCFICRVFIVSVVTGSVLAPLQVVLMVQGHVTDSGQLVLVLQA